MLGSVRLIIIVFAAALGWSACQREARQAGAGSRPTAGPATPPSAQRRSDTASLSADDFGADLDLRGTEPFWEGTIRGPTIVLRFSAEEGERTYSNARLTASDSVATWTAARGADTLVLTMRKGACEDGMSEERYPFSVTLLGGNVTGCGYPSWTAPTGELRASPPFDSVRAVSHSSDPQVTCQVHARRNVVVHAVEGDPGSTLFVRGLGNRRCDAVSLAGDFVWRNRREADYFLGLRGDVLLIDNGTGAENRLLILIDLRTEQQLVELAYNEVDRVRDERSVRVWRGYSLERPLPGCDAPPGAAGVDSLFAVDLSNGEVRFAGRTRCGIRE